MPFYGTNCEAHVRLRSEIWVKAYLRSCQRHLIPALVVRRGDNDAGAIYIKVNHLNGMGNLFGPAPSSLDGATHGQAWIALINELGVNEKTIDDFLQQQIQFDQDLWIIEIEDKNGRHCLDEWLK